MSKEYGVVVVGLGMAGKVRVRDLKEETCGLRLRGVVSRHQVEQEGVHVLRLDEALKKSDVDILIICTEPALHEEYVRMGLENGKHVLVEYPVALSSTAAISLYQLAEAKGLVLYEENIALLTESFRVLQSKTGQAELKKAIYSLKGSYNGWLENFDKSGLPFVTGISGIQIMLSLFGNLATVGGKLEQTDSGYTAHAHFTTQTGKPIYMNLARFKSKDVRREKHCVYEFEDGQVIDTSKISDNPRSKPGLFMQDLENFYVAVLEGKISVEKKQLSIHSLQVAEQIHSFF